MLPVAAIFLITEWLAVSGLVSFASLLGFVTVMTLSSLGAFFPILLALAGRRKSDVALVGFRGPLGSAPVLSALYILFLALIYAYGLVIWTTPLQKGITLLAAVAITVGTVLVLRRGMLDRRTVVEIREDEGAAAAAPTLAVVDGGRLLSLSVAIGDGSHEETVTADGGRLPSLSRLPLRTVRFELPETGATEIKIWVHRVTSIGESVGVPAAVTLGSGSDRRVIDLGLSNGWVVLPRPTGSTEVSVTLGPANGVQDTITEQSMGGNR
jgi:hypothetical protein